MRKQNVIRENVDLSRYTTFRIGGKARYFTEVFSKEGLLAAIKFAKTLKLPIVVLGEGSNVLVSDRGLNSVVIKLNNIEFRISKETKTYVLVKIGAGKNWDELVGELVDNNFQGVECLSGIPGNVGAAPVQNIGAYGQELADIFIELSAYDTKKDKFIRFRKKDCKFGYRTSLFKKKKNKGRYIIFDITLKLNKNKKPTVSYTSLREYLDLKGVKNPSLKEVRKAVLFVRSSKLEDPKRVYNTGSFFKNPLVDLSKFNELKGEYKEIPHYSHKDGRVKLSAGWLIESAGWKGRKYKNVAVSNKHALVIINPGGKGTAREIKNLADKISKDVKDKFGIFLKPEVQYLS